MNHYKRNYAVKLFKTMANANRLKILEMVYAEKNITVNALAKSLGLSQATVSTQLGRMRREGFIRAKQNGQNMHYSIKDSNIPQLISRIN